MKKSVKESGMSKVLKIVKPLCNGRISSKMYRQLCDKVDEWKRAVMNDLFIDTAIYDDVLDPERLTQELIKDRRRDLEEFLQGAGIDEFDISIFYLPHSPRRGWLTVRFVGVEREIKYRFTAGRRFKFFYPESVV